MLKRMRNPIWSREELILALDLYYRHNPLTINKNHKEVVKLSQILNSLQIHNIRPNSNKFRNPNGVYMKLCNFLRFDTNYKGVGLQRGGKLEEQIWIEFNNNINALRDEAQNILTRVNQSCDLSS